MSLITLAIVGKDNTPLYLRDFDDHVYHSKLKQKQQQHNSIRSDYEEEENNDTFGFFESNTEKMNESSSLKRQFVMHSALDRCEELVSSDSGGASSSPIRISSIGPNSMWIGFLGSIGETNVYGYMTTTKIKFMASIEDSDDNGRKHFARESGLKVLFGKMHKLYIEYRMNPFSQITDNTKISSRKFDDGMAQLVKTFNDKYSIPS